MSTDETYNGWTNRETWAVALWINNEQGWQESVLEALRSAVDDDPNPDDELLGMTPYRAGEIVREQVEDMLLSDEVGNVEWQRNVLHDIGSLYRADWAEIGASFLSDLAERDA